ncbi:hypothetical protein NM688_g6103 [Phlebia brevispora]|uniref:Uncharacterized protein n=1 Tax=Phlebia brevispora TaxID=194682 RepID=A0ACC1SJY9_9APHY|nr:hypothetical protein NM688_g6103 [Phlebia brevispora]
MSDIASELYADLIENYVIYATAALAAYEYVLGLGYEYFFVCRCKWTSVTWLFLLNRYFMVASIIVQILPSSPGVRGAVYFRTIDLIRLCYHRCSCNAAMMNFYMAITLVPEVIAAVFSALRVYALLGRARRVLALAVLLLGLTPIVTNSYGSSKDNRVYVDDPVLGSSCYDISTLSPSTMFHSKKLDNMIIADSIVVLATWLKTYQQVKQASSLGMSGISAIFLRDGSIYFIILLILNTLQFLVDIVPALEPANPIANITYIMQPVLISRFMINLRRASEGLTGSRDPTEMRSFSRFSAPNFRIPTITSQNFIDPLAQPLEYGEEIVWDSEPSIIESSGNTAIDGEQVSDFSSTLNLSSNREEIDEVL